MIVNIFLTTTLKIHLQVALIFIIYSTPLEYTFLFIVFSTFGSNFSIFRYNNSNFLSKSMHDCQYFFNNYPKIHLQVALIFIVFSRFGSNFSIFRFNKSNFLSKSMHDCQYFFNIHPKNTSAGTAHVHHFFNFLFPSLIFSIHFMPTIISILQWSCSLYFEPPHTHTATFSTLK